MTLYIRIDQDGIPDELSYYDVGKIGKGQSKFKSQEEAETILYNKYSSHTFPKDREKLRSWLQNNIKETAPGIWGLSTELNTIFGVCLETGYSWLTKDFSRAREIKRYMKKGYYLQVWDGIAIDDLNPVRRVSFWDGDQFIPKKLLYSYMIPWTKQEVNKDWITYWLRDKQFSVPPWEYYKSITGRYYL